VAMQQLMLPLLLAMDATKKGLLSFVQQMGMTVPRCSAHCASTLRGRCAPPPPSIVRAPSSSSHRDGGAVHRHNAVNRTVSLRASILCVESGYGRRPGVIDSGHRVRCRSSPAS
jgi:hypothetical protein